MSRRGASTRTLAIESIRCSPPDSVPASCRRRLARAGSCVNASSSAAGTADRPFDRRNDRRRFSSTVKVANTDRPSGAWATPARAKRNGGAPPRSSPSTRTVPRSGAISPLATRATVVLPTPLAPRSATASPGPIVSDTPKRAWKLPYPATTSRSSSTGLVMPRRHIAAQVGLAHGGALEELGRGALGDQAPEVEHVRPLGEAGDQLDVVLHQEDGEAVLGLDRAQRRRQLRRLLAIEPGGRLVEEQDPGPGHQGPAHLHEAALAQAELLDGLVRQVAQAQEGEHLVAGGQLVGSGPSPADEVAPQAAVAASGALRDEEVLADGRLGEQLDPLEGAADAPAARWWTARPPMSSPSRLTVPWCGGSTPRMQLKRVVFPARWAR